MLGILFKSKCKICARDISEGALCMTCDNKIKSKAALRTRIVVGKDGKEYECRYLFDYNDLNVKRLLYALKRNADKELMKYVCSLYRSMLQLEEEWAAVNVPRRRVSIRNFGYDQVADPLKMLCKTEKHLTYVPLLRRRGFAVDQKNLSRADREKNMSGKFAVRKKDIPKNILLFDDVVTTGSTALSCINAIEKQRSNVNIVGVFLASTGRGTPCK